MKRKTALLCALLACAYLWVFLVLQYAQPRTITLRIGLFAGSTGTSRRATATPSSIPSPPASRQRIRA